MGLNSRYKIRVTGVLDGRWAAWFENLQVTSYGEETVISGPLAGQAALHGLPAKVRDLELFLTPVRHLDPDRSAQETPGGDHASGHQATASRRSHQRNTRESTG
jgi:hypothetical protein